MNDKIIGDIFGIRAGEDISSKFVSAGLIEYNDKTLTICEAKDFFDKVHSVFNSDYDVLCKLCETSILGIVYYRACLACNSGKTANSVPSYSLFYKELVNFIKILSESNFIISDSWKNIKMKLNKK